MKRRKAEEEDYGYLNEESTNRLPMIIGGAVLIVVIIVLCVLIWQLAHSEKSAAETGKVAHTIAEDTLIARGGTVKATEGAVGKAAEDGAGKTAASASADSTQEGPAGSKPGADTEGNAGSVGNNEADGAGANGESTGADSEAAGNQASDGSRASEEVTMTFRDVEEKVTAKDVTNLRSEPSTESDDTVVAQLRNGEVAIRTGVNEVAGWSRLEYEGLTLYAASRLLTTDLTVKQADAGTQNAADSNTVTTAAGRTITFTPCDDIVSPKMEVNLRGEPSTSQGNDTVHHRLMYGENVHRTGYDTASGWSRVEYNGEVLYVVTSLIYVVEEPSE